MIIDLVIVIYTFNFRIYTTSLKSGIIGSLFQDPKSDKYHKIYKNNMNADSFVGLKRGLENVLSAPNNAFLFWTEYIKDTSQYQSCKIQFIPWIQPLGSVSIALQKYSPLEPFMKQIVMDIHEKGVLKKLQLKHSISSPNCKNEDVKAISPEKIIVSFLWITLGIVFSFFALFFECVIRKGKKPDKASKTNMKMSIEADLQNFVQNIIKQNCISEDELVGIIKDIEEKITLGKNQDSVELNSTRHANDECKTITSSL